MRMRTVAVVMVMRIATSFVNAQTVEINMEEVKVLHPIAAAGPDEPRRSKDYQEQFGLDQLHIGYSIGLGENPNVTYRRIHPFPETILRGLTPFDPLSSSQVGIKSVGAYQQIFPWPPPDPGSIPKPKDQFLWQWEVPEDLQRSWWSEAGGGGKDRSWAVCLYTQQEKADAPDPQLFCFDTLKGLNVIPVNQTLQNLNKTELTVEGRGSSSVEILTGISADDSRFFALVSRPDKQLCLLFLYDPQGKLVKTLHLPNCDALKTGFPSWQLSRQPSGRRLVLSLHRYTSLEQSETTPRSGRATASYRSVNESLLVDLEGNIVARFADEEGKPITVREISDTHALAYKPLQTGGERSLFYQLP